MSGFDDLTALLTGSRDSHGFEGTLHMRLGKVISAASGFLTVQVGGDTQSIAGVPYVGGLPASGQAIVLLQQGTNLLGLGTPNNAVLAGAFAYTDIANVFTQPQTINSTLAVSSTITATGTVSASAYKIAGSVGTAGTYLRSNGSTGAVFSAIQASDLPAGIPSNDTLLVHKAGTEVITGAKSFTVTPFQVDTVGRMALGNGFINATGFLTLADVSGLHPGTATALYGYMSQFKFPRTTTLSGHSFYGETRTEAFAFTMTEGVVYGAGTPGPGAGSTISHQHAFRAKNQFASGVANAWGIAVEFQTGAAGFNVAARFDGGSNINLWLNSDVAGFGGGMVFGTNFDTVLYRRSAGIIESPLISASTGFLVNGASTAGQYLRGNGTAIILSALLIGDLPAGTLTTSSFTAANPVAIGTTLAPGGTNTPAKIDHVHVLPATVSVTTGYQVAGAAPLAQVLRGDGTKAVFAALVAGDLPATILYTSSFTNTNPAAIGSVTPGVSTVPARLDHVHALPAISWTAVTFQNSWINNGNGEPTMAYTKDANGFVHLRGTGQHAGGGGAGTAIFTLPAGFRPTGLVTFACAPTNTGVTGSVSVSSVGVVTAVVVGNAFTVDFVSVDNIVFSTV